MSGPAKNTDRELWREREADFFADSIHVTEFGAIGINCGGSVFVKPLREWHRLATHAGLATLESLRLAARNQALEAERDRLKASECIWQANLTGAYEDRDVLRGINDALTRDLATLEGGSTSFRVGELLSKVARLEAENRQLESTLAAMGRRDGGHLPRLRLMEAYRENLAIHSTAGSVIAKTVAELREMSSRPASQPGFVCACGEPAVGLAGPGDAAEFLCGRHLRERGYGVAGIGRYQEAAPAPPPLDGLRREFFPTGSGKKIPTQAPPSAVVEGAESVAPGGPCYRGKELEGLAERLAEMGIKDVGPDLGSPRAAGALAGEELFVGSRISTGMAVVTVADRDRLRRLDALLASEEPPGDLVSAVWELIDLTTWSHETRAANAWQWFRATLGVKVPEGALTPDELNAIAERALADAEGEVTHDEAPPRRE